MQCLRGVFVIYVCFYGKVNWSLTLCLIEDGRERIYPFRLGMHKCIPYSIDLKFSFQIVIYR